MSDRIPMISFCPGMPKLVAAAFRLVRQFHPEVNMVVFSRTGKWLYLTDYMDSPEFDQKDINISVLEDAQAQVENLYELPVLFIAER